MPLISVIVPVYNTGKYLQEAIESVQAQNMEDMEIICVNDGSTDNSLLILQTMASKDPRIQVYSQENQGQSVARNTGMEHATGKYIYFMDSDDILKEECFNRCVQAMEANKYNFVFFDGDILCEEGTPNICWDYKRTSIYEDNTSYKGDVLMHSLLDNYTHRAVPWLLFIHHEYIKRLSLSFYPGIIHEDELYTTLLTIQAEKVGCLKSSFVNHRVRANSTMTNHYSRRNVECYITVVDELMKWCADDPTKQIIIDKYASYTLDIVFNTAHVLPYKQKILLLKKIARKKYLKFIHFKNILRYLFK